MGSLKNEKPSERTEHEWRIQANKRNIWSDIQLNGQYVPGVISADFSLRECREPRLTLELSLNHVLFVSDPELHIVVGGHRFLVIQDVTQGDLDEGLFRERKANGEAHQSPLS